MSLYKGSALRNDLKEMINESPMDTVEYVAGDVLPEKTVVEKSGLVPQLSTSAGMKQLDLKRAPRSTFQRGQWVWGNDSFATYEYGYEEPVDNVEALENADIFNEEVVSASIAKSQLFLAREKRVADKIFSTTTFNGAANTLVVTEEWDDATNAVLEANITAAQAKLFAKAGVPRSQCSLLINDIVFGNAMRTDKVRNDIKYTKDINSASRAEQSRYLADYLHIKRVIVATSFSDGTGLGIEDAVFESLWSNEYGLYYLEMPNIDSWKPPGIGKQPVYKKFSPDYRMESYIEPQSDATIIRAREYRGEYVNVTYGILLSNLTT